MDLSQLLLNLGLNVASNAIYDIVRLALRRSPEVTHDSFIQGQGGAKIVQNSDGSISFYT